MTKTLTNEEILRPSPRRYDTADWIGGQVRLQSLTDGEMRRLRASFIDRQGKPIEERSKRDRVILLCWCLVDDDGRRLFADEDALSPTWDDVDGGVIKAAYEKAMRLTGFAADWDWSAVGAAVKN